MGPGPKESFHPSETVIRQLDGAVFPIDGLGSGKRDGAWLKVGEASRDGSTWRQFLEMKLTRTS